MPAAVTKQRVRYCNNLCRTVMFDVRGLLHSPEIPSLFLSPSNNGIYGFLCLPLRLRSLQRAKSGEVGADEVVE